MRDVIPRPNLDVLARERERWGLELSDLVGPHA